jgi:hypothetical protein
VVGVSEFIIEHVNQRDVQRRGGCFSKYPTSFVVCYLLRRYGIRKVLDVTYGEGRFYYLCKDEVIVVGSDPVRREWVTMPKEFHQLNVFQLYGMVRDGALRLPKVDAVVADPPKWTRNATYRRSAFNYIIGTPELIIEYASRIARLTKTTYLLTHYKDLVKLDDFKLAHVIEFTIMTRYLNLRNRNKSLFTLYKSK